MHRTVLIVDDDAGLRLSVATLLSKELSVLVETAGTAGEAWQVLKQRRFNLALIDLCLPDFSGLELAKRLRDEHINVPWILMSGFMDYDAAHEAGRLGAMSVVALPADFVYVVNTAFKDHSGFYLWPRLPLIHRLPQATTSVEHWVQLVLRACDSDRDPQTLREWGSCVGMSYSRIADASRIIRIGPHDARDFTRVLRALLRTDGLVSGIETILNLGDSRTRDRLMRRAGLSHLEPRVSFEGYANSQDFVPQGHPALLVLTKVLS